jgi:hypothetical protein
MPELTGGTKVESQYFGLKKSPVYQGYLFYATLQEGDLPSDGCLNFPPMRIDGNPVEGPSIPFHKRRWYGIVEICM